MPEAVCEVLKFGFLRLNLHRITARYMEGNLPSRRVMEKVTHLILVSDASRKGTGVIQTIKTVADQLCMYEQAGALINRVKSEAVQALVDTGDVELLGFLPEDDGLAMLDIQGRSLMELDEGSPTLEALQQALRKMEIL